MTTLNEMYEITNEGGGEGPGCLMALVSVGALVQTLALAAALLTLAGLGLLP